MNILELQLQVVISGVPEHDAGPLLLETAPALEALSVPDLSVSADAATPAALPDADRR